ncbi:MAG: hypothetical protein DMF67_09400 [Acidobacteria bacterium]|nr:MAG: hypothetical protein DMF66_03210 [Acidobacteriota bacterium]PYS83350.1 MAG: hypothetical protein DMF67_09400 [Acidobacteriota bacterium]
MCLTESRQWSATLSGSRAPSAARATAGQSRLMKPTPARRAAQRRSFEERLTAKRARAVEDAKFRARQAQGKLRRFVRIRFRREEVVEALALRRGDCNRCGACCEILFKCPFLKKHRDGTTSCGIYEDRPSQCRLFPLDRRDLAEVRGTCSFYFIEKPIKLEKAS